MAASTACRFTAICRQFQRTVKISLPTKPQYPSHTLVNYHSCLQGYVLLKEKNMLNTIEQEAKRKCVPMPSPERVKKVFRSMKRLDSVVKEREDALRLLQTGQEKGRPGEWRRNIFGKTFWYRFREHPVPWYMNKIYKRKRFYTPSFVAPYTRLSLEKHLKSKTRRERKEKQKQKKLQEVFSKKTAQV
ncbi:39S ribosomal protein L47, mitochondrial [Bagarius yarrelli]|uniref:Large ribosomal subunit protein uL29m n=1 Tax=Bagarius yarrelli TaxID=175774 RepID=A0A556VYA1_BAGYA|nr:39S ribosomal protein L47, mitochondrial [Bagarius yarrelli]